MVPIIAFSAFNVTEAIAIDIGRVVQGWAADYPALYWAVSHPIWSVILFLISLSFLVFAVQSLLKLLNQAIVAAWLAILKSPFMLSRSVLGLFKIKTPSKELPDRAAVSPVISSEEPLELSERLQHLESLEREQIRLLEQIVEILQRDRATPP